MKRQLAQGDYVLATKYRDGDPCDHFVVGFFGMLQIPLWLGYLVVIILGITNALNGKRFVIPGISEFAEKL